MQTKPQLELPSFFNQKATSTNKHQNLETYSNKHRSLEGLVAFSHDEY
tara:strand:- start:1230 stop:1373 length:144 start_codon:yes stop_codon:yes gene_type:complete